jgi:hypothetical protein
LGKRSRKRSSPAAASRPKPRARPAESSPGNGAGSAAPPRGYARSREKDEAARAALVPLEEGERPRAVTAAALYALFLALAQIVVVATGHDLGGSQSEIVGPALFVVILLIAAWGCWTMRYWAVLGMQALLALIIIFFSLAATRASAAVDWLIVVGAIVPAGILFWYLVKALARIQMPERPGR